MKPLFFRHLELFKTERESGLPIRVAFAGLWTAADREGRFRWEPEVLKLDCLPYDQIDFSRVLDALVTRGFVEKYTSSGRDFGWIPGFKRHQIINNRESISILPEPPPEGSSTRVARDDDATRTPLNPALGEGKGREGKGREYGIGREVTTLSLEVTSASVIDGF